MKSIAVFCFLVVIFSTHPTLGQQADRDPMLAWYESFFAQNTDSVTEDQFKAARMRLDDAMASEDPRAIAREHKEIAMLRMTRLHDYDSAIDHLVDALRVEDSLQLKVEKVFTFMAMAWIYERVGAYHKSAAFLKQAAAAHQLADGNDEILVKILIESGNINVARGKLDDASENYEEALQHIPDEHPDVKAEVLFNKGHLLRNQKSYEKSLDYHKKALSLWRRTKNRSAEAKCLNAIAELYLEMQNEPKALANHQVALEIRTALDETAGLSESYVNIGKLYFKQKNYEDAILNLMRGLEAGRESQHQLAISESFEYLSLCYRELGDYKKALEYKESFIAINDFIQSEKSQQEFAEKQNQYELEKREAAISRLETIRSQREKELQAEKKTRNFLFALVALATVVMLLIFILYILKRRSNRALATVNKKVQQQNDQLQELNATKDKFFSIISHDLKGPLNSLTSFSGLLINHTDSLSKDEIRMLAKDLDKSLKNLFNLLENLLEWSRSQTGNIEFKPEAFDVSALLQLNIDLLKAQAGNKQITLEGNFEPCIVAAHKHSVNTVIRNLTANAIKFTPSGGKVRLSQKSQDGVVTISITDTGVGMGPDIIEKLFRIDTKHSTRGTADEKGTGLGLILCKDFVEKNNGKLSVQSQPGKGSVFSFTLPAGKEVDVTSVAV